MIVVRFRDGRDDELKEWYENLPEGERSRIIRKILIDHIIVSKNKTKSMANDIKPKKTNSIKTDSIDITEFVK